MRGLSFLTALFFLSSVLSAAAATFSAQVNSSSTCSDGDTSSTGAFASCPSVDGGPILQAVAASGGGFLRVGTNSQSARSGGVLVTNSGLVTADARFRDTLNFSIDEGVFRIDIDILGELALASETIINSGASIQVGIGALNSIPTFSFFSGLRSFQDLSTGAVSIEGQPGAVDIVRTVDVGFTGGRLDLQVFMNSQSGCGSITLPDSLNGTCFAQSTFENSLRLVGGEVLDVNGNTVRDGYLGSVSGFDYATGIEGHDRDSGPLTPVPLPASGILFGATLLGMSFFRRQMTRSTSVAK